MVLARTNEDSLLWVGVILNLSHNHKKHGHREVKVWNAEGLKYESSGILNNINDSR